MEIFRAESLSIISSNLFVKVLLGNLFKVSIYLVLFLFYLYGTFNTIF